MTTSLSFLVELLGKDANRFCTCAFDVAIVCSFVDNAHGESPS